jgi:hypothetical protein
VVLDECRLPEIRVSRVFCEVWEIDESCLTVFRVDREFRGESHSFPTSRKERARYPDFLLEALTEDRVCGFH